MRKQTLLATTALALAALVTTACSSGGSGTQAAKEDVSEPSPEKPRPVIVDRDPIGDHDQVTIKQSSRGNQNPRVKVGVVDTGVNQGHPEFADYSISEGLSSRYLGGRKIFKDVCPLRSTPVCSGPDQLFDESGHGTAVASVVNGANVGYSGNAQIINADIDNLGQSTASSRTIFEGSRFAKSRGAEIINISFDINPVSDFAQFRFDPSSRAFEDVFSGSVLVVSGGNGANGGVNMTDRDNPARNWKEEDPMTEQFIAVGSLNNQGDKASYSAYPGSSEALQSRFISAPGRLTVANSDYARGDLYQKRQGTSLSAPVVSAAMSTVLSSWDFLSAKEAANVILDSADQGHNYYSLNGCGSGSTQNCGSYYFGAGVLDLESALEPIGEATIPVERSVEGRQIPARYTAAEFQGAFAGIRDNFGDELDSVMVLDDYDRDFQADISTRISSNEESFSGSRDIASSLNAATRSVDVASVDNGDALFRASFAGDLTEVGDLSSLRLSTQSKRLKLSAYNAPATNQLIAGSERGSILTFSSARGVSMPLHASDLRGVEMRYDLSDDLSLISRYDQADGNGLLTDDRIGQQGMSIDYAFSEKWSINAGVVLQTDVGGLLGMSGKGALSTEGVGESLIPGVGLSYDDTRFSFFADYQRGKAQSDFDSSGIITDISAEVEKLQVGASIFTTDQNERLTLSVSSPMHVTNGVATIKAPVSRSEEGEIRFNQTNIDLESADRPVTYELGYRSERSRNFQIGANIAHSNSASGEEEVGVTFTSQWRY